MREVGDLQVIEGCLSRILCIPRLNGAAAPATHTRSPGLGLSTFAESIRIGLWRVDP